MMRNYLPIYLTLVILISVPSCKQKTGELDLTYKATTKVGDIEMFEDTLVKPIDYLNLISLKELPVEERKTHFIQQILPSILICQHNIQQQRDLIQTLASKAEEKISGKHQKLLDSLYAKYKASNVEELLVRVNTHPVSIVLAQAALESAWGTSRFYSEGNNVFGIWSFSESDNRMASLGLRNGKPVYLKKYNTLSESVEDYFLVLGRGPFSEFREHRLKSTDPNELVNFLINYSEKRNEYAQMLLSIIRKNNLTQYDRYRIDPEYIR